MLASVFPLLLLASGAALAELPPGATVDQALVVDVTPDGFDAITGLAYGLVPPKVDIPDVIDTGDCPIADFKSAWAGLAADDISITTSANRINLQADVTVWINDASDPFELVIYTPPCGWFGDDTCNGYVTPFPVSVQTYIDMKVDPYTGYIVADVGELDLTYNLSNLSLEGCWISFLDDTILGILEGSIDGVLQDALGDLPTEIETILNDTFANLSIDQTFDLGDQEATLHFAPSNVMIEQEGFRLAFEGAFNIPQTATCVQPYDPGGSVETAGGLWPPGAAGEHIGANIADDFANSALYAVWRSGLLCIDLGGEGSSLDLPLPLDTSLLPLLFGDMFDPLFPEAQPLVLSVVPEKPPTLDLSRPEGAGLAIDDFGLSIITEIEGRKARLLDVALDVNAGADIGFDAYTGLLSAELDLSGESGIPPVTPTVRLNEFAPGTDTDIADGLAGLLENPLISGLIGDALGDTLGFYLPAFCSFGVTNSDLLPTGPNGDWLGIYLWAGPVDYSGSGGCAGDGGGCGGGCGGTTSGSSGSSGGCDTNDLLGCGGTATDSGYATTGGCDTETCDTNGCTDLGTDPIEFSVCGCSASGSFQSRILIVAFALLVVFRRRRA